MVDLTADGWPGVPESTGSIKSKTKQERKALVSPSSMSTSEVEQLRLNEIKSMSWSEKNKTLCLITRKLQTDYGVHPLEDRFAKGWFSETRMLLKRKLFMMSLERTKSDKGVQCLNKNNKRKTVSWAHFRFGVVQSGYMDIMDVISGLKWVTVEFGWVGAFRLLWTFDLFQNLTKHLVALNCYICPVQNLYKRALRFIENTLALESIPTLQLEA